MIYCLYRTKYLSPPRNYNTELMGLAYTSKFMRFDYEYYAFKLSVREIVEGIGVVLNIVEAD